MTRSHRIQFMQEATPSIDAEMYGVDLWLDNLATVLQAVSQRRMTDDQVDRYALLLQEAELDALRRTKRRRLSVLRP